MNRRISNKEPQNAEGMTIGQTNHNKAFTSKFDIPCSAFDIHRSLNRKISKHEKATTQ